MARRVRARLPVTPMKPTSVERQFTAALDALVEQVKGDRSILAAILCGSLSHDTVWAKSDIDLVLVTIDDKKVDAGGRGALRRRRERPRVPHAARRVPQDGRRLGPQLVHALVPGQGPAALHARPDDRRSLRPAAGRSASATRRCSCCARRRSALPPIDKAHKWFVTRGDLDYTALWILYAATPLAQIEVIGARLLADREVIPQALKLNPAFFKTDLHRPAERARRRGRACRRRWTRSTRYMAERARDAVRAGDRPPARGRRGAVVHRDRGPLQAELRRRAA